MLAWLTVAVIVIALVIYWVVSSRYRDSMITANSRDFKPSARLPRHPNVRLADAMMVFVSMAVLCSSLFIILSGRYDDASQKWAYASVGSIVGFWCRRSR